MVVQAKLIGRGFASALGTYALVFMFAAVSPATAQTVDLDDGASARVAAPAQTDALQFSSEGLNVVDAPGGGQTVHLEGRFKHYLVAHKGPDGKLHVGCTQDAEGAHSHSASSPEVSE